MTLTIKGVTTFIGREGHGFNATLYMNGVKVAFVFDDASGGCIDYQWASPSAQLGVEKYVETLPPTPCPLDAEAWEKTLYPGGFRKVTLDDVMDDLINNHAYQKQLARHKKTCVCFTTGESKPRTYFTIKHQGESDKALRHIMTKYPDAVIL